MKKFFYTTLLAASVACSYNVNAQTEVKFYTTMGDFTIALTDNLTPITVDSFLARVGEGFYDGLTFHRVIDGFMIQGGDPNGNGTGGPGYTIPDEFNSTLKNVPKALAMANTGQPHTGGCQFFINLVTNSHLNNKHTVFGMVTENFTVVQNIGKTPVDGNDKPITAVVIDSIRITKFPVAISKIEGVQNVTIYPNPNKGVFTISLPDAQTNIEILNLKGELVFKTTASKLLTIELANQPAGLYFVRGNNKLGSFEGKVIVQ